MSPGITRRHLPVMFGVHYFQMLLKWKSRIHCPVSYFSPPRIRVRQNQRLQLSISERKKAEVKHEKLLWLLFLTLTHFFGMSCSNESARRKIALQPSIMKISINRKISFHHVRIMMSCQCIHKYTALAQKLSIFAYLSSQKCYEKSLEYWIQARARIEGTAFLHDLVRHWKISFYKIWICLTPWVIHLLRQGKEMRRIVDRLSKSCKCITFGHVWQ